MPAWLMKASLLAFALGCLFLHQLPSVWPTPLLLVLLCASLLLLFLSYIWAGSCAQTERPVFLKAAWPWLSLAVLFILGLSWSQFQVRHLISPQLAAAGRMELEIQGTITSIPQRQGDRLRFYFSPHQTQTQLLRICPRPCQIRLDWYRSSLTPRTGEGWAFTVRLGPPSGPLNHFGLDVERQAVLQGWQAQAVVVAQQGRRLSGQDQYPWQLDAVIATTRQGYVDWLGQKFTPPVAAVLSALLVGERGGLDDAQWNLLARTGTSHLLAISGLHVGLVAALCYGVSLLLLRGFSRYWPDLPLRLPLQQVATLTALPLTAFYAVLSGFQVSTQRALVMLLVAGMIVVLRRQRDPWLMYLWAMTLVLLGDPGASLGPGFWLSFGAVAWLIYGFNQRSSGVPAQNRLESPAGHLLPLNKAREQRPSIYRRGLSALAVLAKAQLFVSLGLLPLTLVFFQQVSVIGPLVNLFAVPWVSLCLLPLSLFGLLVHLLGGDWPWLWLLMEHSTGLLLDVLGWFGRWTWAEWHWGVPTSAAIMAVLGLVHMLAPRGVPLRSLAGLWLLPLLFPAYSGPTRGELWVYQFDVGQGSALALRTANHMMLYDTGPGDGAGRAWFEAAVLPGLRMTPGPELLLVSHSDLDHAGGLAAARENLRNPLEMASFGSARRCQRGQHWVWDEVEFFLLHPGEHLPYLGNESSCVLLVRQRSATHGSSILIPGDLGHAGEQAILQAWQLQEEFLHSQVLVLGHHGSRGSTSDSWLDTIRPDLALLSRGRYNRFGFPHPELVDRLSKRGISWLDSAHCGGILLRFDPTGKLLGQTDEIWAARDERRWWRSPSLSCRRGKETEKIPKPVAWLGF